MAVAISDRDHFRLLAEVRWQAFRNSLRPGFKRVEVLLRALTWVGGVGTVAVIALLMGVGGYFLFVKKPAFLSVTLWLLFVAWQLLPLIMEGSMPALDFRQLARYPIRFRLFATMSLAYGVLDPIALSCIACLAALGLGCIIGQPAYAIFVLLFFGLFVLFNLLLNRIIQRWVERITATRRGRELLLGAVIGISVLFQFFFWFAVPKIEKDQRRAEIRFALRTFYRWSPPGLVANGAQSPSAESLRSITILGLGVVVLGGVFFRQVRGMYLGELESEGVRRSGAIQVQPGWELPFAGPQMSAMFEKEMRQALGVGRVWINQLIAWCMVLLAGLSPEFLTRAFGWKSSARADGLLPFAVGYSMIILSSLAFNVFWSDAGGIYRWLLSPIDMRRLLVAKNLFFGIATLFNFLVISALIRIGMPITALQWLNTLLAVLLLALGLAAVGNILSVWFPKKVEATKFNTKNASDAATLIGLICFGSLIAVWVGANWVGRHFQQPMLGNAVLLVAIAFAVGGYLLSLNLSARYLERHTEKICEELA